MSEVVQIKAYTETDAVTGVEPDVAWMQSASCRGLEWSLFFPSKGDASGIATARAVCSTCPVQDECLTFALDHDEHFGMWGGRTQKQLSLLRRARRWIACAECGRQFLRPAQQSLYCPECQAVRYDEHAHRIDTNGRRLA